ncbi:MAG: hypothetical protein K8R54_07285 [Bacteroidales bacterium]|nr:hypothetical protein [Bacteroidales bacterium]
MRTIISNLFFAQTFKEYWSKADSLYRVKKYKQAGVEFDNALKLKTGNADNYFYAATAWASAGDTSKAFYYLNLTADKGWYRKKIMESIPDFVLLYNLKAWDEVLKKVQMNLDEYEKGYNIPLKRELENIKMKDQLLRNLICEVEKKYAFDSDEYKYFWELILHQDSLNLIKISEIIKEHNWPGISLVGEESNITVWLVIQHAPLETQEHYLPYLQESVKKGESRGRDLAYLEDRILMLNGKPQKYGSQFMNDPKTGEFIFYEIEDPENINKRRAEVGLDPIEEYMKRNNIKWRNNKTQ